jgi:hypothetical protein
MKNKWIAGLTLIMMFNLGLANSPALSQNKGFTKPAPLTLANIFNALTGSNPFTISQRNKIATQKVLEWGIDFSITPDIEKELRKAKASDQLIAAIRLKSKILPPSSDPVDAELSYWESIKDGENEEDFKTYLSRYPNGRFLKLANERLQELQKVENLNEEIASITNSDDLGIAGTWTGTRGLETSNAFLMISGSKGHRFTGVLKIRGFHIAVQGQITPKTRQIIMQEIKIIETGSEVSWTLSAYSGALSRDKKEMSGMMQEGAGNIAWSFIKVD